MKYLKKLLLLFTLFIITITSAQETVAILPFSFTDDGHLSISKGKEVQHFLIDYIHKKGKHFNVIVLKRKRYNCSFK